MDSEKDSENQEEVTSEDEGDDSSIDADMQGPDYQTEEQLYQKIL